MMGTELKWTNIATVAAQKGYENNIGTAGLVKGVLGNKLIFGGGANFPGGLPVDGGVKVNHKDIYLYEENSEDTSNFLDVKSYAHSSLLLDPLIDPIPKYSLLS